MIFVHLQYCTECGAIFIDPPRQPAVDVSTIDQAHGSETIDGIPGVFLSGSGEMKPGVCSAHTPQARARAAFP